MFDENFVFLYFIFHILSSFILALILKFFFPKKIKGNILGFFTLIIFFSGPAGFILASILYITFLFTKEKKEEYSLIYEPINLKDIPQVTFQGRKLGESSVLNLNLKTVFYLRQFLHPASINLLKRAISANNDEIRLLSFSTINAIEKRLFENISMLKQSLKLTNNNAQRFNLLSSLAEMYWEFVYLGIADKELEEFYLKESLNYVKRSLEIKEESKLFFLMGRIYIKLGEYEKAKEALLKAINLGFPPERVIPYLLEAFYNLKDFSSIIKIMGKFKDIIITNPRTVSILKTWI
ncbi:MAG TPA: hypothetical protein EYG91_06085 [Aquifex aeolicus]|nr:hypothetical protein [Aquifex aeolicus]